MGFIYIPADGGGTLTGANNGLSLSGATVQLGGALIKTTTIDASAFDLLIRRVIDANRSVFYKIFTDGGVVLSAHAAENTVTQLAAAVFAALDTGTDKTLINSVINNLISGDQTGFTGDGKNASIKVGGDLYITYNNLVGTPDVYPTAENITADNGATGTMQIDDGTKFRITPTGGDWLSAASITGDNSGFTADITTVEEQEWLGQDHSLFEFIKYMEYSGKMLLGHDLADRPSAETHIRGNSYVDDLSGTGGGPVRVDNAGKLSVGTDPTLPVSGSFTPTITMNPAAGTATPNGQAHYIKVGNIVTIFYSIIATPATALVNCEFQVDKPVAYPFPIGGTVTAADSGGGGAARNGVLNTVPFWAGRAGLISANFNCAFTPLDTTDWTCNFSISYSIV